VSGLVPGFILKINGITKELLFHTQFFLLQVGARFTIWFEPVKLSGTVSPIFVKTGKIVWFVGQSSNSVI
jgi:hypothetical protein